MHRTSVLHRASVLHHLSVLHLSSVLHRASVPHHLYVPHLSSLLHRASVPHRLCTEYCTASLYCTPPLCTAPLLRTAPHLCTAGVRLRPCQRRAAFLALADASRYPVAVLPDAKVRGHLAYMGLLCFTVLRCTARHCNTLYSALNCAVFHCTALYCTVLSWVASPVAKVCRHFDYTHYVPHCASLCCSPPV